MSQQLPPHSGLRALQGRKELEKLVKRVKNTRDQMQWGARGPPPLLIKLAPDLTDADKSDIATVCLRLGVDGLVVSNTTITRPGAVADHPTGSEVSEQYLCLSCCYPMPAIYVACNAHLATLVPLARPEPNSRKKSHLMSTPLKFELHG